MAKYRITDSDLESLGLPATRLARLWLDAFVRHVWETLLPRQRYGITRGLVLSVSAKGSNVTRLRALGLFRRSRAKLVTPSDFTPLGWLVRRYGEHVAESDPEAWREFVASLGLQPVGARWT